MAEAVERESDSDDELSVPDDSSGDEGNPQSDLRELLEKTGERKVEHYDISSESGEHRQRG